MSVAKFRTVTITKQHMLDAARHEPLIMGMWVDHTGDATDDPTCGVCAVGGTLRRAGLSNREIVRSAEYTTGHRFTHEYDASLIVEDHSYPEWGLSALSCYWESIIPIEDREDVWDSGIVPRGSTEKYRGMLVDWIEENIPDDYSQSVEVES